MGVFDIRVNEKMCWNVCKCVWNVKNVCWVELPNEPKSLSYLFFYVLFGCPEKKKKAGMFNKKENFMTYIDVRMLNCFGVLFYSRGFSFFFLGSIMVIFMYCLSFHFHCYIVLWGWGGINMGQNGLLPFSGKLISLLPFFSN